VRDSWQANGPLSVLKRTRFVPLGPMPMTVAIAPGPNMSGRHECHLAIGFAGETIGARLLRHEQRETSPH
jgi:hypothetical protein